MPGTFTCRHCGTTVPHNPCLKKKQEYCSSISCQQARMRNWKKRQYDTNKTYRKKNLESQRKWRKERPGHEYQKQYRETHPEYVDRNRELQSKRNCKRKKGTPPMIVNGNALSLQANDDAVYTMKQVSKGGKIVNGNTFLVQMRTVTASQVFSPPKSG